MVAFLSLYSLFRYRATFFSADSAAAVNLFIFLYALTLSFLTFLCPFLLLGLDRICSGFTRAIFSLMMSCGGSSFGDIGGYTYKRIHKN